MDYADVIFDKTFNHTSPLKLESLQDNAALVITRVINLPLLQKVVSDLELKTSKLMMVQKTQSLQ